MMHQVVTYKWLKTIENFKTVSKSGCRGLWEVVELSLGKFGVLDWWSHIKGDSLQEVVAHGGLTVLAWKQTKVASENHHWYGGIPLYYISSYFNGFFCNIVQSYWLLWGHMASNNNTVFPEKVSERAKWQNLWPEKVTVPLYLWILTAHWNLLNHFLTGSLGIIVVLLGTNLGRKCIIKFSFPKNFSFFFSNNEAFFSVDKCSTLDIMKGQGIGNVHCNVQD